MAKTPFMEELDSRLRPEERMFKLKSAELIGDDFRIDLLVSKADYDNVVGKELEKKVKAACREIIPDAFKIRLHFSLASSETTSIIKRVHEYIYNEKPTVYNAFLNAPIEVHATDSLITVVITLEKYMYEYAVNSGLKTALEEYLGHLSMEDYEVEFCEVPNVEKSSDQVVRPTVASYAVKVITVSIEKYLAGGIAQMPRYISDVKERESAQCSICGVVAGVETRYIEKIDKTLFTFNLNDTTGVLKVKYFAKKRKGVDWEEVFVDGTSLVMEGQIKFDKFDNKFCFFPRNIAKCVIDYTSINQKADFLPEPENYVYIHPQPIEVVEQASMFGEEMHPDFYKNVFVVFDVETTGLNVQEDKIIEIAAIKIVDGVLCESFDCLINPEEPLPPEIVELTHITDEMLAGQHTMRDVIGDFFKFTRGAVMVAHNAPFYMGMITVAGQKYLYDFNNAYRDTLSIARQKLKLKNYKLATVCDYFNVPLVGAHRAINDTLATAQMFVHLTNMR